MSSTVLRLSDKVDDVRFYSAVDCLKEALERTEGGYKSDPDFKATGCIVLMLDQNEGKYRLKRHCSSLKTSELIALLEIAKQQELNEMRPCVGE